MTIKLIRILIIEDNIDHIELLMDIIERHFAPIDIHTVETMEDAFDFIEQTNYDIVLTDCYLNDESIVDQIPELRSKLDNVPLIVITGSGDENLAATAIKKGANDYLVKTKETLEEIPVMINKYIGHEKVKKKKTAKKRGPIKDRLLDEVANLNKQANRMVSHSHGRIPDIEQLESLLNQIQRLKELASKLMEK